MAIIVRADEPTEPVAPEPPKSPEKLSVSAGTAFTPTDAARLEQACAVLGVTKAAFLRAAALAKLDVEGK